MKHAISVEDHEFLVQFIASRIQPGHFHHSEHVRLAYIFLVRYGHKKAYPEFRASLQAFLRHHGIDAAKYHETLTQAWLLAVFHFMEISPPQSSAQNFIDANPPLLDSKIMLTHYSRELMESDRARQQFVEPDRQPIPAHEVK